VANPVRVIAVKPSEALARGLIAELPVEERPYTLHVKEIAIEDFF